uniref:Acylglycerol kinase, mitochondrial n=1 Tax=Phallusia mammillata TaxID=59560 RepID=A0A6F9D6J3_9ASCI|nr:acylglycerol kinase, mitochondrial-like [Phallusia mammillata]
MNAIKSIRNNPKKSIAGALVATALGKWINGLYNDHLFRFTMCHSVEHIGTEPIKSFEQPKKITVFLNPAANSGKATTLFDKNAAPILYLSGCQITVIKSEYEGQAKQFMSVLDKPDMIVAAGGDGTVNEVVTGLLRRPDFENWRDVPIGIIPLGKTNTICRLLSNPNSDRPAKWIMESTSDLLEGKTRKMDIMKIEAETGGKPVFALSDIRWGSYRDAVEKTNKYWYFGPLKKYMTFVFASFRTSIKTSREIELSYIHPQPIPVCEVKADFKKLHQQATASILSKLFGALTWWWPWKDAVKSAYQPSIESTPVENPIQEKADVYDVKDLSLKTLEFMVTANSHDTSLKRECAALNVSAENDNFSMMDYIQNGPNRNQTGRHKALHPTTEIECSKLEIKPDNVEGTWFSVDSENYEAMPCTIEVIPNKLKMVCSSR